MERHTSGHSQARTREDLQGLGLLMVHGSPRSSRESAVEDPAEPMEGIAFTCGVGMVFGHTHIPFEKVTGGVRFVNACSMGSPRTATARRATVS
jgi:predicted phosphodiesterase